MKKILTFLLIFASLINFAFSSELSPYSIFGKENRIKETSKYKNAKISEKHTFRTDIGITDRAQSILVSKEYFDDDGNLVKFESYADYNAVLVTATYKYNEEGMLLEIEEKDNFRTILLKQVLSYDPFDKLVKITATDFKNDTILTTTYDYIPEKSVAIETIRDSSKKVNEYTIHLYDKAFNRVIKTSKHNQANELNGITAIHYNDYGISSREVYTKDITEPYRIKYQNVFNDKGLLTGVRNLKYPDELLVDVINEYNEFDLIKTTTMKSPNGDVITSIFIDYTTK